MTALRIGVCGNGTVGGGTIDLLRRNEAVLAQRAGRPLLLTRIGARRDREDCPTDDLPVHRDLMEVAVADDVDVLVECIGGTGLARELVSAALAAGKSVVTANKALIAEHGNELLRRAEEQGVSLLFEAAVAGAIPVLKTLRDGLAANRVDSLGGIINGTGNFILTEMGAGDATLPTCSPRPRRWAMPRPTRPSTSRASTRRTSCHPGGDGLRHAAEFSGGYCEGMDRVAPQDLALRRVSWATASSTWASPSARDEGVELRVHPDAAADRRAARQCRRRTQRRTSRRRCVRSRSAVRRRCRARGYGIGRSRGYRRYRPRRQRTRGQSRCALRGARRAARPADGPRIARPGTCASRRRTGRASCRSWRAAWVPRASASRP
jgi:hypothetical protein